MQQKSDQFNISPEELDRLISAHDGNMALVFLHQLRTGKADREAAAAALCLTGSEIDAAQEKLRRMELVPSAPAAAPAAQPQRIAPAPSDDDLPQYTTEEIGVRFLQNTEFLAVRDEATRVIGKALSSNEILVLCGIYDHLGMPADVMLLLLNYCAEVCRARYGESRRPTARTIKVEAYRWANEGIMTYDLAEEYIARRKARSETMEKLLPVLGIRGRALTETEKKYISSWLDMGFGEEALSIAYDRTVTNTGSLKWSYMNSILQRWNEKKLYTAEAIRSGDSRPSRASAAAKPSASGQRGYTQTDLDELFNKI